MLRKKTKVLIACLALILVQSPALADQMSPLTTDAAAKLFSQRAFVSDIALSPDGKHYLAVAEENDDETASIFVLQTNELVKVINFDRRWKAGSVRWISNSEIAISPRYVPLDRYAEYGTGELVVVNLEGKIKPVYGPLLTRKHTGALAGKRPMPGSAVMLDPLLDEPGWIRIRIQDGRFRAGFADLEYASGKLRGLKWGPNAQCLFSSDTDGKIKFCSTVMTDGGWETYPRSYEIYALDDEGNWELAYKAATREMAAIANPIEGTNKFLAYKESASSIIGLYEYDLTQRKFRELYTDDEFDLSAALSFDVGNYQPRLGSGGIAAHAPTPNYIYVSNESFLSDVHQRLAAAFPGNYVGIGSVTKDKQKLVFSTSNSTNPRTFYLYDLEKQEIRFLADSNSSVKSLALEKMEPFSFSTRDGLKVHGMFTPGAYGHDLGSVVLVHGGPHGPFDRYGYDREVHFFSQLGYNVIQVNFRGSGGFGRKFEEAGYLEWSGKMIDDIVGGADFVIAKKGLSKKACIYGGSYGGFASASAVFRYPEYFKCAAGHVGVYDLEKMYTTGDIPERKSGVNFLREVISDDKAKLRKDSPTGNVDKIKVPMLLTHGKQDFRADPVHSRIMEKKLKAAGKPVEATYISREMHGFASADNERKRLSQLGDFMRRHMPHAETDASALGGR